MFLAFVQRRREALLLGMITLAALALRVWALGSAALLPDEGSSVFFSQLPLSVLLWSHCDPHPPGYYLLLRAAMLLGQSEAILRLPSALAGTLAVPLTWAVGRAAMRPTAQPGERWPDQAALLAAALVAFAPLAVWYSREARPYAALSLLTLAMAWAGLRWRQRPGVLAAAAFLVAGWLALWVEYGALAILFGLNLFVLSGWPWRGKAGSPAASGNRWLALQALLLAPFALWWLLSAQRTALAQMSYQAIFLAAQAHSLGLNWTPELAGRVIVAIALAAAGLGLGLAVAVRRSVRARGWLGSPWVAAALLGLAALLALLGALPRLYTVKRHLNAFLPFVSIAAAWALLHTEASAASMARRVVASGMAALLLALSLAMPLLAPEPAWREAVAALREHRQPGDALWVDELDAPVFVYYWGETGWDWQSGAVDWQPLRARDLPALNAPPDGQRVWLLGSISPYRDLRQTLPEQLARRRAAAESYTWRDVALTAYDASATPQPAAEVPLVLGWGLRIQSPLDIACRP